MPLPPPSQAQAPAQGQNATVTMHNLPPQAATALPVPRQRPIPVPMSKIETAGLPIPSQGLVHSPRPLVSPKQTYAVDPLTHATLPKSERVEELEREIVQDRHHIASWKPPRCALQGGRAT